MSRRRIQSLESEVAKLRFKIDNGGSTSVSPASFVKEHESAASNLSESTVNYSRDQVNAYERASDLITRGHNLKDVAHRTGLSVSELQLMNKVSNKIH